MIYKNGRIYVIRNYINDLVYVGSTVQTLARRMSLHKQDMKRKTTKLCNAFTELGFENFYIELLEIYPCNNKEELTAREGHYIRQFDSFKYGYNGLINGRTDKERSGEYNKMYYEKNKDKIKEQSKTYREKNRETILEKEKEHYRKNKDEINSRRNKQVECQCGGKYTLSNKAQHLKTNKHISFSNNK